MTKLPTGLELTPFDDTYRANPYPRLANLRETCPVYRGSDTNDVVVTSQMEVQRVLRDKDMLSDPRKSNPDSSIRLLGLDLDSEPSMLFADDPQHKRLRGLVNKAFTPRAVEQMRSHVKDVVAELLDEIASTHLEDGEFDLIEHFAGPVPTVVIAEMLGVDTSRREDFKKWSDTSTATFFNPLRTDDQVAAQTEAGDNLWALFREEIAKRREEPQDDLISAMIAAEDSGDRFTEDEIIQQCNLLLIAGNVTTCDLIGNGVKALLDHPEQLEILRNKPELINNAVEEMLRFESPVINSGRIAPQDMEIDGCPVHKGESVMVSLGAANRDPSAHNDPDVFNVERQNPQHNSFGGGRHFCLGAPLARLEAQEAVGALVQRFPNLQHAERAPVFRTVPGFRGMEHFWVRVTA